MTYAKIECGFLPAAFFDSVDTLNKWLAILVNQKVWFDVSFPDTVPDGTEFFTL